jgi:hypothetical protein
MGGFSSGCFASSHPADPEIPRPSPRSSFRALAPPLGQEPPKEGERVVGQVPNRRNRRDRPERLRHLLPHLLDQRRQHHPPLRRHSLRHPQNPVNRVETLHHGGDEEKVEPVQVQGPKREPPAAESSRTPSSSTASPAKRLKAAPIAVAIAIRRAKARVRTSSGRKSRIHGFQAAPEMVPRAEATISRPKSDGALAPGRTAQGTTSTPSQASRAKQAAHQQMAFRIRQRSMSATVGSWRTWVAGPRADRSPTPALEARGGARTPRGEDR